MLASKRSSEKLARLFREEARISGSVRHPNLLEIIDAGEDAGVPFLAMEWVEGVTLRRLAERPERMPLPLLLRVLMEACDGLHAAHEARTDEGAPLHVVHRDVSPHNLLVSETGRVKVIDFGIAKANGRLAEETTEGVLRGKVRYMAPEHALGQQLDRRADVWSLGVTLLETATGKIPYSGEHDIAALVKLVSCEPELPDETSLPAPVWAVVKRALRKNRDERFATTREMGTEIETYLTAACPSRNTRRELAYLVREELKAGADTSPKRLLAPARSMSDVSTERHFVPRVILPQAPTRDAITAPVPHAVLEALIAEELREKPVSQHPTPVVPPEVIPAIYVSTSTAVILPAEARAEMNALSDDSYSDAGLEGPRPRRRSAFVIASVLMALALAVVVGSRARVLDAARRGAASGVAVETKLSATAPPVASAEPPPVSDSVAIAPFVTPEAAARASASSASSAPLAPPPAPPAKGPAKKAPRSPAPKPRVAR